MTSIKILLICILITVILTVVILCVNERLSVRNNAVLDFRLYIIKQFYNNLREKIKRADTKEQIDHYRLLECTFDTLLKRYTYEKMLYSFKPLKLKTWYTEEEIKLINGNY